MRLVPFAAAAATIAAAAAAQGTHKPIVAGASAAVSPKQSFVENCSACHQENGKGIPGAFPALAGDPFVLGAAAAPIGVVLNGRAGMPTFKADLSNEQIAAALTYVRASWGNNASVVTPTQVAALRTGEALKPPSKRPIQAH